MKILAAGDVHAQLKLFAEIVNKEDCDIALQCGDFGIWDRIDFMRWGYVVDKHGHYDVYDTMVPFTDVIEGSIKFEKPLYFIAGNHENFNYLDKLNSEKQLDGRHNTIHIGGRLGTRIFESIDNGGSDVITIAGLNGCYSYKVFTGEGKQKQRKIKVKPETPPVIEAYLNEVLGRDPRGRFTYKDTEKLKKIKADILMLHEVPLGVVSKSELNIDNEMGCSAINEIIEEMRPKLVVCGHIHQKKETFVARSRVVVLPKLEQGYIIIDTKDWSYIWK